VWVFTIVALDVPFVWKISTKETVNGSLAKIKMHLFAMELLLLTPKQKYFLKTRKSASLFDVRLSVVS
jgi:hypothetical protein